MSKRCEYLKKHTSSCRVLKGSWGIELAFNCHTTRLQIIPVHSQTVYSLLCSIHLCHQCGGNCEGLTWPHFKKWQTPVQTKQRMTVWINALNLFVTPVVLPRIHLCVLHSVLFGEEHEGIHWPLAFCRCGTTGCSWGVAPVWFATGGLWGAGALKFITVWTDSTTAGQGGSALTSHAAENIHCWRI